MQVELNIAYNTFVADLTGAELEVFTRIVNKLQMVNSLTTYEGTGPVYPLSGSKIDWRIGVNTVPATVISEAEAKDLQNKAAMAGRANLVKSLLEDPVSVERRQQLANQLWYDSIWTQAMSKEFEVVNIGDTTVSMAAGGKIYQIDTDGIATQLK